MSIEKAKKAYTIDATSKSIGRVATDVATALLGKNDTSYQRHLTADVEVTVTNASKIYVPRKKQQQKKYAQFSGYPGGLRFETLEDVITKKGYGEAITRAVYGMLPANKLRKPRLKNLVITD